MHGVSLYESLSGLIVSFALDSLDFSKEFCEQGAEFHVIVHYKVGFAVTDLLFDDLVLGTLLKAPFRHKFTVLHMGLSVGASKFHAGELDHEAVADIICIFCLICLRIRHDAKFHHLGVCGIIQAEKVCSGFLKGRCIFSHCGGAHTGEELT